MTRCGCIISAVLIGALGFSVSHVPASTSAQPAADGVEFKLRPRRVRIIIVVDRPLPDAGGGPGAIPSDHSASWAEFLLPASAETEPHPLGDLVDLEHLAGAGEPEVLQLTFQEWQASPIGPREGASSLDQVWYVLSASDTWSADLIGGTLARARAQRSRVHAPALIVDCGQSEADVTDPATHVISFRHASMFAETDPTTILYRIAGNFDRSEDVKRAILGTPAGADIADDPRYVDAIQGEEFEILPIRRNPDSVDGDAPRRGSVMDMLVRDGAREVILFAAQASWGSRSQVAADAVEQRRGAIERRAARVGEMSESIARSGLAGVLHPALGCLVEEDGRQPGWLFSVLLVPDGPAATAPTAAADSGTGEVH